MLTQIQDLQNKVHPLSDAREIHDFETASSSGTTHVPSQASTVPSPRTMTCRDSGLPHDARILWVLQETFFERLPARKGRTSTLFNNSKNLATSQELRLDAIGNTERPEIEMRREPQNSSILVPRFQSGGGLLHHTGGTFSHGDMMDYTGFPISELHVGKFL